MIKVKYHGGPRNLQVGEFDSLPRVVRCHDEARALGMVGQYRLNLHMISKPEKLPVLTWHEAPQ